MEKLDFNDKWINMIIECISLVSHSVLVNGEPRGKTN